jgi:hypothetical protein
VEETLVAVTTEHRVAILYLVPLLLLVGATELGVVILRRLVLVALVVVMAAVRVLFIQAVQQRLGKVVTAALVAARKMAAEAEAVLGLLEVAHLAVLMALAGMV